MRETPPLLHFLFQVRRSTAQQTTRHDCSRGDKDLIQRDREELKDLEFAQVVDRFCWDKSCFKLVFKKSWCFAEAFRTLCALLVARTFTCSPSACLCACNLHSSLRKTGFVHALLQLAELWSCILCSLLQVLLKVTAASGTVLMWIACHSREQVCVCVHTAKLSMHCGHRVGEWVVTIKN